jgi:hypothetical protein
MNMRFPPKELTPDEQEHVKVFVNLTEESWILKRAATVNAKSRRDEVAWFIDNNWSLRRIGDLIGVTSQRIDSMRRMHNKESEADEGA